MGTRSVTKIIDNGKPILALYRQMDGYPDGHGKELKSFLTGMEMVNGLSTNTKNVFNGMGCLAAQIVAHFKDGAGGFYISSLESSEAYNYEVIGDTMNPEKGISLKVYSCGDVIYEGSVEGFDPEMKEED